MKVPKIKRSCRPQKKLLFIIDPSGDMHERLTSEPFTHVALMTKSKDKWIDRYMGEKQINQARQSWSMYNAMARRDFISWDYTEEDAIKAESIIDSMSRDQYVAVRMKQIEKNMEKLEAEGYFDKWNVIGWTTSLYLAEKLFRSQPLKDRTIIVETTENKEGT